MFRRLLYRYQLKYEAGLVGAVTQNLSVAFNALNEVFYADLFICAVKAGEVILSYDHRIESEGIIADFSIMN